MNRFKKIKRSAVLQQDSSDCGVACLMSIIRYYGGNSTIEIIRSLSGTTKIGSSMLGLYQAANHLGLDATGYEAEVKDLFTFEHLLILHVNPEEGFEHYIVCFGFENGKFIVWDPSKGLILISESELEKIWHSRKCLGLAPNNDFKLAKENNKGKIEWIIKTTKPEKDLLIVSVIIGILISMLGLVMAVFTQKLIDEILPSKEIKALIVASVLVLILISTRIILLAIRQFLLLTQGKYFNIRIVDDFFNSLLFLPLSFFDSRKSGDFVARLNDTMRIQRVIASIVGVYIIDILILCITIIMLFYYSKMSAIISVICLPALYLTVSRWNNKIIASQHSVMSGYALSESNFINSLKGIAEIKSMNLQNFFSEKNNVIYMDFQERAFVLGKIKVKLNLLTGLAGSLYIIIVLIYSSGQVIESKMTQGELLAILALSSYLLPSVLNLALISIPISEAKVALNRMFEFTQNNSEEVKYNSSIRILNIEQMELKKLTFRFPGKRLLLDNINLLIEKGKITSLVGESGCGKSTLSNIIQRFYTPESGNIILNNELDANEVSLNIYRSKIGVVPQEIHIFNGTVLQYLLAEITEDKINELISTISVFGLSSFIDGLPSGLMTLVGEDGINLSGGQKQLLVFIKVLMKKPDILIIDEGTSNMDRATEGLIINIITKLKPEIGILLISHRINVVKALSDSIYVIEDGIIKITGTHNDLIKGENLYKRFWDGY